MAHWERVATNFIISKKINKIMCKLNSRLQILIPLSVSVSSDVIYALLPDIENLPISRLGLYIPAVLLDYLIVHVILKFLQWRYKYDVNRV